MLAVQIDEDRSALEELPERGAGTTTWRQTDGARFTWLGTDCNNAHVQPTGAYHYHGIPESLINRLGEGPNGATDMIAAGWIVSGEEVRSRRGASKAGIVTCLCSRR